jgi:Prp8 binding protein
LDICYTIVAELKQALSERGLATDGLKADLVNRLQASFDDEEENDHHRESAPSSSAAAEKTSMKEDDDDEEEPSSKRPRTNNSNYEQVVSVIDDENDNTNQVVTLYNPPPHTTTTDNNNIHNIRTSSLASSTMKLTGHKGSIYTLDYDPHGEVLCSGSFDSTCLLWNASGYCENFNVLSGHKNAILDVKFTNTGEHVVTASADYNLGLYDVTTGNRMKRFMGHTGIVNAVSVCCDASPRLVVSASDDRTCRLWDTRVRGEVGCLEDQYQITAVAYANDGQMVFTGGIDNCITAWDVRQMKKSMTMKGHTGKKMKPIL